MVTGTVHAQYVGNEIQLASHRRGALIRPCVPPKAGCVLAQFDMPNAWRNNDPSLDPTESLAFGWHEFNECDFQVDPE
jgi:hypothetical protein